MFLLEIVPSPLPNRMLLGAFRLRPLGHGQEKGRGDEGAGWDKLTRRKLESATAQYGGGNAGHEGLRLEVKIAKHFVGAPAADHTDAVAVDSGRSESTRLNSSHDLASRMPSSA